MKKAIKDAILNYENLSRTFINRGYFKEILITLESFDLESPTLQKDIKNRLTDIELKYQYLSLQTDKTGIIFNKYLECQELIHVLRAILNS